MASHILHPVFGSFKNLRIPHKSTRKAQSLLFKGFGPNGPVSFNLTFPQGVGYGDNKNCGSDIFLFDGGLLKPNLPKNIGQA